MYKFPPKMVIAMIITCSEGAAREFALSGDTGKG